MTIEKAIALALPNFIVLSGIVIAVAVWLCRAFSYPRNKRISILLNGFAIISFIMGYAFFLGPNPEFHIQDGLRGRFIPTGSGWSLIGGILLALLLHAIARTYANKDS